MFSANRDPLRYESDLTQAHAKAPKLVASADRPANLALGREPPLQCQWRKIVAERPLDHRIPQRRRGDEGLLRKPREFGVELIHYQHHVIAATVALRQPL